MFVSSALHAPGLAQSFALIIAGLCRTTASRIVIDRSAGPLLVRIFTRLHRLAARFTSLAARVQGGTPPPPPQPGRPVVGAIRPPRRKPRLPESRGWLVRLVPGSAAYVGQVQALLADPQTAALMQAAPQAGRILRPLSRMLAIPFPDDLRRPGPSPAPPPGVTGTAAAPAAWSWPPACPACLTRHRAAAIGLPPRPD